jgi:hypothetical protein
VTITLNESMSLRDAKTLVHFEAMQMQMSLDLLHAEAHRAELKILTKKVAFVEKGKVPVQNEVAAWKKLDLDLDEDETAFTGINLMKLEAQLGALYKRAITRAAEALQKSEADERKRSLSKDELTKNLLAKTPKEHLEDAIGDAVIQKLKAYGITKVSKVQHQSKRWTTDSASLAVQSLQSRPITMDVVAKAIEPKNGLSPPGGGVVNKGKGKAEGKGNNHGKGKGKRKTKGR